MKAIAAKVLGFGLVTGLVACGAGSPQGRFARPADADIRTSQQHLLEGQPAEELIQILFKAGVRDPSGRLGALHLAVDGVECSAAVVAAPAATCTLIVEGDLRPFEQTSAQMLFQLLLQNGAKVPGELLGTTRVAARSVDCQRSVTRTGVSRCTFDVPTQD